MTLWSVRLNTGVWRGNVLVDSGEHMVLSIMVALQARIVQPKPLSL
jgi:hypothetical protein